MDKTKSLSRKLDGEKLILQDMNHTLIMENLYRPKYFKYEGDFDTIIWQFFFLEMKQREFGKEINIT